MKKHSSIIFLSVWLMFCSLSGVSVAGEATGESYRIEPERIVTFDNKEAGSMPVPGKIEHHYKADGGIYYLSVKDDNGFLTLSIGFFDFNTKALRDESKLPVDLKAFEIKKFVVEAHVAFVLVKPRENAGEHSVLYRINLNSMDISSIIDAADFYIDGGELFFVDKSGPAPLIVLNESRVPVTLGAEGDIRIHKVVDGRIVFVTNGADTEIIDIRQGKNLYRYSPNNEYLATDEYNIIIQTIDSEGSEHEDRGMFIYKIFIDGIESGRTDAGPAGLMREYHAKLEPNRYHQIKLERWALNLAKGRYDRINNIYQPKTQEIFMPMNRVVKLTVRYLKNEYKYDIASVFR